MSSVADLLQRYPPDRPGRALANRMLKKLAEQLRAGGVESEAPLKAFFVPGRIEILGKHTDYCGGRSLVSATEQGLWVLARRRSDRRLEMTDVTRNDHISLPFPAATAGEGSDWSVYPRAVANRFVHNLDARILGADIAFASTLPAAAGLSSSSALVVATFLALAGCNGWEVPPRIPRQISSREALAAYLGAVENGSDFGSLGSGSGVGTRGGNQDHTAILCCAAGRLHQYGYLPTRLERAIVFPEGLSFVVAVSGVQAEKTGRARDDYNRVVDRARRLLDIWNRRTGAVAGNLASALSSHAEAVDHMERYVYEEDMPQDERRRLISRWRHFVAESEQLVPGAGEALAAGDLEAFAACVDRSQDLANRWLGNQVDETVWLAAAARELGAHAASSFGAGFGGAVWALADDMDKEAFVAEWARGYRQRFPGRGAVSSFFTTNAGGPAVEL